MNEEQLIKRTQEIVNELKQKHHYTSLQLAKQLHEEIVPITIFATKHSPLQSLVTYLQQQSMNKQEIAKKIQRTYRSVWGAQLQKKIMPKETNHYIPLTIFNNKLSILEAVVQYMKETQKRKLVEIARLLNKDQRTIWTIYNRAKKKNEALQKIQRIH